MLMPADSGRFDFQPCADLLAIGYQSYLPASSLACWVQLYWRLEVPPHFGPVPTLPYYPDGGSNLTFEFRPQQLPQVLFQVKPALSYSEFVAGQQLLSVRFQPTGAFQLLGLSPADFALSSAACDVRLLQLPGLEPLLQQLALLSTADSHQLVALRQQQQIHAVELWLLQLARRRATADSLVQRSLTLLRQPATDLQHLYQQLPKSRRQFERLVKLETGLSPAQLQLLYKVKLARAVLSQQPLADVATVAQQVGFYDQAHLHQHFVRLTGQTPGQYKRRKMSQISKSRG